MSLYTRLQELITAIGTDFKRHNTWITGTATGADLTALSTTAKTSLVAAINEVNGKSTTVPAATEAVAGIVELATAAEVAAGTDSVRAVTPAGVRQERIALKNEILGAGLPAALDTLDELANAIGDDANFAGTVTTGLANRVRVDVANQALTTVQQSNARTNIGAVGTASIGDPEADLVALYTLAKA